MGGAVTDALADHLREHGVIPRECIAPPTWTWPPVRRHVAARIVADHGGRVVEVHDWPGSDEQLDIPDEVLREHGF